MPRTIYCWRWRIGIPTLTEGEWERVSPHLQTQLRRSGNTERSISVRGRKHMQEALASKALLRTSRSPASRKRTQTRFFIIDSASMALLAMFAASHFEHRKLGTGPCVAQSDRRRSRLEHEVASYSADNAAQPFLQADPPIAVHLSQTLGRPCPSISRS